MKAVDFIKKFWWCEAKSVLLKSEYHHEVDVYLVDTKEFCYIAIPPDGNDPFVGLSDLKQYVDAWDLVQSIGGLKFAKNFIEQTGSTMDSVLEEAIALVEEVGNE